MTYAADVCDRHADLHTLSIAERKDMSMEEAAPYIWVTKWFCAGVATYVVFIWSLKINMLFFYKRVVNGTTSLENMMPKTELMITSRALGGKVHSASDVSRRMYIHSQYGHTVWILSSLFANVGFL